MLNSPDGIKQHLLKTMIYFHDFCEEHSLEYFLVGGTLLGAVRHKGFIPWDDDIDVVMPRNDYNKLKSLADKFDPPYIYKDYTVDNQYIYPFAKICNDKLIVEEDYYKPFQCGVWVDVFPLDSTFNNIFLQKVHFLITDIFRKLIILKYGAFKLNKRSAFSTRASKLLYPFVRLVPRGLINSIFYLLESCPLKCFRQKNNLANLYGAWGVKEVAPAHLFSKRVLYDFEGHQFWGVENADFWLKKVYGDYMTPPPVHKRIPVHIGRVIKDRN